jgi:hydrogenase maturation protease
MNEALVSKIVRAVLYEGYVLYPYRPSVKNQQRWTFGVLHPRSYSQKHGGGDAWATETQCLLQGDDQTLLTVTVGFLHLQDRLVGKLEHPRSELLPGDEPAFAVVERLLLGDRLLLTWQEAVEQEHSMGDLPLSSLVAAPRRIEIAVPAHRQLEPVVDPAGAIVAVLVRERHALSGAIEVAATPAAPGLFKVRARVENLTPLDDASQQSRERALSRSLVSTHTILSTSAGEFVSLLDPPAQWRAAAASCQNLGAWPVLAGDALEKDTMLSAPIILYDYPQIAPESPGDLFDSTEIDEILSLRILTLTDTEKQAAAAVDERVRALLSRTETLDPNELLALHGAVRGLRAVPEGGLT